MIVLDPPGISKIIKDFNRDSQELKEQIADICVYLAGGVDYSTAWAISYQDRELLIRTLNKKNQKENPNSKEYM